MQKILERLGFKETEHEVQKLIERISLTKLSANEMRIQFSDFLSALINCKTFLNRERLWSIFKYFDQDHKNFIDVASIKAALAREGRELSENKLLTIFSEFAKEHAVVDFETFCELM